MGKIIEIKKNHLDLVDKMQDLEILLENNSFREMSHYIL